ncbi:unnamed protein product [Trichogramma brassicae]|uniref:Uncharacterized protein n=1 Tax=Trichogramma brassicae TaxID=86971 RepID=A0A6H5J6E8_9HYME|nr:unnamed protein product [Trichogramma brassicae]
MYRGGAKQRRCFDVGFVLVVAASEVLDECSSLIIIPTSTRVIDTVRKEKINLLERKNLSKIYIGAIIIACIRVKYSIWLVARASSSALLYCARTKTFYANREHIIIHCVLASARVRTHIYMHDMREGVDDEEPPGGRNRGKMSSHVRANDDDDDSMTIILVFIRAPYPFLFTPGVQACRADKKLSFVFMYVYPPCATAARARGRIKKNNKNKTILKCEINVSFLASSCYCYCCRRCTQEEKKIGAQLAIRIYITWDSFPAIIAALYTVRLNLYIYLSVCAHEPLAHAKDARIHTDGKRKMAGHGRYSIFRAIMCRRSFSFTNSTAVHHISNAVHGVWATTNVHDIITRCKISTAESTRRLIYSRSILRDENFARAYVIRNISSCNPAEVAVALAAMQPLHRAIELTSRELIEGAMHDKFEKLESNDRFGVDLRSTHTSTIDRTKPPPI